MPTNKPITGLPETTVPGVNDVLTIISGGNSTKIKLGNLAAVLGASVISGSTVITTQVGILVDATSAAVTLTLPSAVGNGGRRIYIKDWKGKAALHNITLAPVSAQTIDGAASKIINTNYAAITLFSDNTNWVVI